MDAPTLVGHPDLGIVLSHRFIVFFHCAARPTDTQMDGNRASVIKLVRHSSSSIVLLAQQKPKKPSFRHITRSSFVFVRCIVCPRTRGPLYSREEVDHELTFFHEEIVKAVFDELDSVHRQKLSVVTTHHGGVPYSVL